MKQTTFISSVMFLLVVSLAVMSLAQVSATPDFTMAFTTPTEDQVFNQDFFTAVITASETLDSMDINLDGGAYYHACNNCNGFSVPVDRLQDGQHNLNLIGVSLDGFTKDITINFSVDTTPEDTTAPTVSSTNPANGVTNVAVNSNIQATFSEAMSASSITSSTFTLNNGATGSVSYSGNTATLNPTNDLAASTTYTATITTGVEDSAGNNLASNYVWSFTTAADSGSGPNGNFVLTFTTPTEDQVFTSNAFTAAFTSSETLDSMNINLDGGSYFNACNNCNGASVPVNNLQDGAHTLNLVGTWGAFTKDITVNFSVDTSPSSSDPLLNFFIYSPIEGNVYNQSTVDLSIGTGNANSVNYSVDSGAYTTYTATTLTLAQGVHNLTVRASSTGEFRQESRVFTVNLTQPSQPDNQTNQTQTNQTQTNQTSSPNVNGTIEGYIIHSPIPGATYNDTVWVDISMGTATNVNYTITGSPDFYIYTEPRLKNLTVGNHTINIKASNSQAYNETEFSFIIVDTNASNVTNTTTSDTNTTNVTNVESNESRITIVSPADGLNVYTGTGNTSDVNFTFFLNNTEIIANCDLMVNGSVVTNTTITSQAAFYTMNLTLAPGTYVWQINCSCIDEIVNVNSSIRTLIVNNGTAPAPVVQQQSDTSGNSNSGSSGGSSGGGSGSSGQTFTLTDDEDLTVGVTQTLGRNDKIVFVIAENNNVNSRHTLTVDGVGNDYVNITIRSTPIMLRLNVGQSVKLNLSSGEFYDTYVKLENIIGRKANITVQSIHETMLVRASVRAETNAEAENEEPQVTTLGYGGITGNAVNDDGREYRKGIVGFFQRMFRDIRNLFVRN